MFSSVQRTLLPFFMQSMFNLFKNFTNEPVNDNLTQRNSEFCETNQSALVDTQEEDNKNNQIALDSNTINTNTNTNFNTNPMLNSSQHSHRSSSPTIFNLLQDQVRTMSYTLDK